MECPRCNTALPDNTRFCPSCGLPVEDLVANAEGDSDDAVGADAAAQKNNDEDFSDTQSLQLDELRQPTPNLGVVPKRAILVAICAALLAVFGIVAAWEAEHLMQEEERRAAEELVLSTPQSVEVKLAIPTSENTHSMLVPVHVVGTTKKDTEFDETKAVSLDEPSFMLVPGTYKVNLAGYSLSNDGYLYRGSIDSFEIDVNKDGVNWHESQDEESVQDGAGEEDDVAQTLKPQAKPVFAFAMIAPERVDDEEIESARLCLEAMGTDPAPYIDAANARRTEAIDRIRAEGEAHDAEQMSQAESAIWYVNQQLYERELAKEEEAKK